MKHTEEIKVIHVMKDGSRRQSVAGMVVPAGNGIYQIVRQFREKETTR